MPLVISVAADMHGFTVLPTEAIKAIYRAESLKLFGDEGFYGAAKRFSDEDDHTITGFAAPYYRNTTGETKLYSGSCIKNVPLSSDPAEAAKTVEGLMKGVNARMTDLAMEEGDGYLPDEYEYLHDLHSGLQSLDFGSKAVNRAFLRAID